MVLKRNSSEVGKSTSELSNHTSKSIHFAQIDLKLNNADVEKTRKPHICLKLILLFPKHPKSLKSVHYIFLGVVAKSIGVLGGVPTNPLQNDKRIRPELRDTTQM